MAARKKKTAAKKRVPKRSGEPAPVVESGLVFAEDELRRRVAGNLARLLEQRGMDERSLAVALGWTEPSEAHGASNVRKYLRGEVFPRETLFLRFSEALACDPGEFLKPP